MSAPQSVTVIDPRVGDIAAVIAGLPAGGRVFVLDGTSDGLSQISALLTGIDGIAALHIISHGGSGMLTLGSSTVDSAALAAHADDLAAIGSHLAPGADILLYGCDVAAGASGAAFISTFAALTGADIAASTDVTGAAALGGNWTLEARHGAIEASSLSVSGFHGLLDTINGTNSADVLIGTAGDDIINGLGGNDTIAGLEGNDVIDGGNGVDTMSGGIGDDTYIVNDSTDKVIENAVEGIDTVQTSVSYVLSANVENLTLLGTSGLNAVGNTLANTIVGNTGTNLINGGAGDDFIDGKGGRDTLIGGTGDDTYVLDNLSDVVVENDNEGTDTVRATISYALGKGLENLLLLGTSNLSGVGNSLNNAITGNDGDNILTGEDGNDVLDGGAGSDTMIGGVGNDTFVIDQIDDVVSEQANQGNDTVKANYSYSLLANFENLVLTGTDAIDGVGSDVNNLLTGNSAANILQGLGGNDTLDGGAGNDTLIGGTGDDSYIVDSSSDVIVEQVGEGTDRVQSSMSYTLEDNIESITLTGIDAIDATGNASANVLTGNTAVNHLNGLGGNDTLDGGKGADLLAGGEGDDTYVVDDSGDVTTEAANAGTDTVRALVSLTLAANVENLILIDKAKINGTGNALANTITGNDEDNVIDGGAGADIMTGDRGADTYYVDNSSDVVIETTRGNGTDTVISSASYVLTGFVDNLVLTGTADLTGTGDSISNTITGNSGRNVLDGGASKDLLDGRDGSDIYLVSNAQDQYLGEVQDTGTTGTDEVRLAFTAAGHANFDERDTGIERIVIGTGTGAIVDSSGTIAISVLATKVLNALTIIGNAGANRITGTGFGDVIDGGAGIDAMAGGKGDDTYYIDDTKDRATERAGAGNDTVFSSASYKLSSAVETLTLTGSDNLTGTGSSDANTLNGNSGNNVLDGGKGDDVINGFAGNDTLIGGIGNDTLAGGSGADVFAFRSAVKVTNGFDTILDFSAAEGDSIQLAKGAFRGLGSDLGQITADEFWSGAGVNAVHDATDRIVYNTTTGNLWYDSDGIGGYDAILIAQLGTGTHPALSYTDIFLVG
ncbi:MAG: DUF4347 domain-containing protein [Novosphingobium sp.]